MTKLINAEYTRESVGFNNSARPFISYFTGLGYTLMNTTKSPTDGKHREREREKDRERGRVRDRDREGAQAQAQTSSKTNTFNAYAI